MANGKDSSAEQASPLSRRVALGGVGAALVAGPSVGRAAPGPLRLELVAQLGQAISTNDMAWSPDGSRLAAVNGAGFGRRVAIFDTASWRLVAAVSRTSYSGKPTLGFAADGRELVTGPSENRRSRNNPFAFAVFDIETGKPLRHARWPEGFPYGEVFNDSNRICVSPDGRYAVVIGDNAGRGSGEFLYLYDVARAEFLRAMETPRPVFFRAPSIDRANRLAVSVKYIDRGFDTAGPAVRNGIEVFELPSLQRVLSLEGHLPGAASMAWSPTGDRLLSGANDVISATYSETDRRRLYRDPEPIRLWDGQSGAMITSFPGRIEPVYCLSWHPSGEIFASASEQETGEPGGLIQILPARGGAPLLRHFALPTEDLDVPCFCPQTGRLAWGERSGVMIHKLVNA